MKVDLSKKEIELLQEALITWQQEPQTSGLNSTIFSMMASAATGESREERMAKAEAEVKQASVNAKLRERQAVLLRAKLIQAENSASEHEIEAPQA